MKFFHVYNEHAIKGLEKNNLINSDTGFKVQNTFSVPVEFQFNSIAKIGGKLHSIIKEGRYPFYIDRIAGGVGYWKYEYDKSLLDEYASILGDWFLGTQLHESGSGRRGVDWGRIRHTMGHDGPYDVKEMKEKFHRDFLATDGTYVSTFNQGTCEYYAARKCPRTIEETMEDIKDLFLERLNDAHGYILPCDSGIHLTRLENEVGMKSFMPEVGCQIPMMRKSVSLNRGMAKAYGKTWGTYYECWRYNLDNGTYSMPCFNNDKKNEWFLSQEQHGDDFTTYGENGGSSRLLQDRIYHYALMAGADYFSEEWGLNCSYTDMFEFTLSKYGMVKKNFIDFAHKMRGIKAHVPFAIVLPKRFPNTSSNDHVFGGERFDEYLGMSNFGGVEDRPYEILFTRPEGEEAAYLKHVDAVLSLFFSRNGKFCGNEGHTITNSRFGDIVDIVYEDVPLDALKKYNYLIDASIDSSFIRAHKNDGLKILDSENVAELGNAIEKLVPELMPCTVSDLFWIVSTDEAGERYLTIFNNEGNFRCYERGDVIDNAADKVVEAKFKENTTPVIIQEGYAKAEITKQDDMTYKVKVPAASFVIMKF